MATAELKQAARPDVVLTLTADEAEALKGVLGAIAGRGPIRKTVDSVWAALGAINVTAASVQWEIHPRLKSDDD